MTPDPGAAPAVGIVGGGMLGAVLALRLSQAGQRTLLLEGSSELAGLAGTMAFGSHRVDRFYHVVVPSDQRMIALAGEVGLGEELEFSAVGAGFWIDGALHRLDGVADFARFGALSPQARLRLAWFVAYCQLRRGYDQLEDVPLERWLLRHCGSEVVRRIWRPLLDSRFEGAWSELPATYLWSRTRRMSSARSGTGRGSERMGHVRGGHRRLIEAVTERARAQSCEVRLNAPVAALRRDGDGAVTGVVLADGEEIALGLTLLTFQPPGLARVLPDDLSHLLAPYPRRHLGVVCLVVKSRRSLLPCYSLNICDPTPVTTIVETSHVVGTDHTDGLRLLYLPYYCERSSAVFQASDDAIRERFAQMLADVVPTFDWDRDITEWTVQRAPVVEPVHPLGARPRVAPIWPGVSGLGLASASQIYPRLLNGESVVGMAEQVAAEALVRLRCRDG